jgi:hypothetical protein
VVLLLAHAGDTEAQMRSDAFLFIPEQAGLKEYWWSRGPFDAEGPLLARSGRPIDGPLFSSEIGTGPYTGTASNFPTTICWTSLGVQLPAY